MKGFRHDKHLRRRLIVSIVSFFLSSVVKSVYSTMCKGDMVASPSDVYIPMKMVCIYVLGYLYVTTIFCIVRASMLE
jgi:hypothetical protein